MQLLRLYTKMKNANFWMEGWIVVKGLHSVLKKTELTNLFPYFIGLSTPTSSSL